MSNNKMDFSKLDKIIKKTIQIVDCSKNEIYDIAESAKKESVKLEQELEELKKKTNEIIEVVEVLEDELKESKRKLMLVNKNYEKYSQEELKEAYKKADNLRMELAVKREQEYYYIKRRNEIEFRIKNSYEIAEKADKLISHVGVALSFLTGDLQDVSVHLENLQQKQLMGLKIIKAQEDERQRVAREIHDGPAQSMSNVVLKAEICEKLADVDIEKSKDELRNLKRIVRESLQDVRKIIYNLRPMSLDDLGLVPTLQRFLMTFQDDTNIAVSFRTRGTYDDIRPEISLTVFRIVQEAMSNINKHAEAQNVAVNLEFMEKQLVLYVFDDGKGFNIDELSSRKRDISSGFGLISMRERAELLSGEAEISSEPGKGTRINVKIPLTRRKEEKNE